MVKNLLKTISFLWSFRCLSKYLSIELLLWKCGATIAFIYRICRVIASIHIFRPCRNCIPRNCQYRIFFSYLIVRVFANYLCHPNAENKDKLNFNRTILRMTLKFVKQYKQYHVIATRPKCDIYLSLIGILMIAIVVFLPRDMNKITRTLLK